MSFSIPSPAAVAMPKPSPTAMQPSAPQGQKPQAKSSQPTAIPGAVANPANTGQKTLLGQ